LTAHGLELVTSDTVLPIPMYYSQASYDGENSIYLMAVTDHQITIQSFRFNIITHAIDTIGEMEPSCKQGVRFWTGNNTLTYFGGVNTDGVWEYNASDPRQRAQVSQLPNGHYYQNSGVWDGSDKTYIYPGRVHH